MCRTHNVDICRECTVHVHNPSTCEVISLKDEIEEKKSNQLNEADTLIYLVNGSIYHLNDYQITKANSDEFKKNEMICLSKEIESEISCLSKAIESDKQLGIEANKAIEKNKEIKKILASAREKLKDSTKKSAILESCSIVKELTTEEKAYLKRLSGQMMWVVSQTRPDLSFETCVMSNTDKHPSVKMLHEANKAVFKLKSKRVTKSPLASGRGC